MDNGYKVVLESPRKKATIISKLFIWWIIGIAKKGTKTGLNVLDLFKVPDRDKSKLLGDKLEKIWQEEIQKAKSKNVSPSLTKALLKNFLPTYMLWGILYFLQFAVLRSLRPLVLSYLISLFSAPEGEDPVTEMYIYSITLVALTVMATFAMHHTNFGLGLVGMRIRIATSALVYRKMTRLNQKSLNETAAGQVVNILSNDVNRFDMVVLFLHCFWMMPFQIALVTFFLWEEVQISCLAGILSMTLLSLPVQGYLGRLGGYFRASIANKTDNRVTMMNEVISGIQVIKMYAWEKSFEKVIKRARAEELKDVTIASYLRGIYFSSTIYLERTSLFLTVICYVLLGNKITAAKVFAMAQFFNILQLALAYHFPNAVSYGAESMISIQRLQEFLLLEEKQTTTIDKLNEPGIQMSNVTASWTSNNPILKNISIQIPPGLLCAIIGPVGSGKSSLLQLLLGELPAKSGKVSIGGEISYSCQEPWLFSSTVRNNILFGQPFDKLRYRQVIKVCCLERDFEQFPQGDKTLVGERGVSLSGGQRARINLARAVYRQADIYIMDDPLSAVDTLVGKQLFDNCINEHLKGKTRILVTHQLQYLKKADFIIFLNDGVIEAQGSYEELANSKLDFIKVLKENIEPVHAGEAIAEVTTTLYRPRAASVQSIARSILSELGEAQIPSDDNVRSDPKTSPFREYLTANEALCLLIFFLVLLVVSQAVCTGADYWMAYWTGQEEIRQYANDEFNEEYSFDIFPTLNNVSSYQNFYTTISQESPAVNTSAEFFDYVEVDDTVYKLLKTDYAMYIYGILIVGVVSLTLLRAFLFFKLCMLSSEKLHSRMFHALLKAPMRFFDVHPSGRILNRFSKDMGAIDETLPRAFLDTIQIILIMFGILINIAIADPYMIIAMLIFGAIFLKIRDWFSVVTKEVKHLESTTKSPVFSHVNSTLNGLATIRASKLEQTLIEEFDKHQDVHTSAWYLTISSSIFFGLWLDIVSVVFLATVTFSFIGIYTMSSISDSLVGLAISQCLVLNGMLQQGMRQIAELIQQLISVERVLQYTKIDTEGPFETPQESLPPDYWPTHGKIEFKHMSLKYVADDPPVLNNLNFVVRPGEKIGIVGRTGAGKSSLISALFRLAPTEGTILIDGIDTKTIGLSDLRKKISIIPQEPVLFSASLRYNLDPFNEFEDAKLWKALEEVELKEVVDSLDFVVTEGGNNFSLGQKQLICLARAILRNNKILVLDEATANVDQRTDSFIQATIRKKFKDCTVLTIAHRLNTIMDSDKVLVMSFGNVVEFDDPHNLLQTSSGYFHKMLLETDPVMAAKLKEMAHDAYKMKKIMGPK